VSTNVDVIKGLYDAVAKGDVPTMLAGLDLNVEWTETEGIPYAGTHVGPDAVLNNVLVQLATEWDVFTITPQDFIDGGDRIVVPGRYACTYQETGKSFECDFAHIWTVREGKVIRFHQYVDSAIVQEALKADS
jgi:ketosteroid isomerase-like protein